MKKQILSMSNIVKTYFMGEETQTVLKGIHLTVSEGEFVSVLGPSGSGKSTLMNIIGCLDTPTSGSYILSGRRISQLDETELAHIRSKEIGFIFQSFQLLSRMTALENVELPLIYAGVSARKRKEKAKLMLERVGLSDKVYHYPNQLSGGQQQRVAIARALSTDPTILLADEPTGALDQKTGKQVIALFEELHREGRTIIMITHDVSIAQHGSRIVRILDGNLLEEGEVSSKMKKNEVDFLGQPNAQIEQIRPQTSSGQTDASAHSYRAENQQNAVATSLGMRGNQNASTDPNDASNRQNMPVGPYSQTVVSSSYETGNQHPAPTPTPHEEAQQKSSPTPYEAAKIWKKQPLKKQSYHPAADTKDVTYSPFSEPGKPFGFIKTAQSNPIPRSTASNGKQISSSFSKEDIFSSQKTAETAELLQSDFTTKSGQQQISEQTPVFDAAHGQINNSRSSSGQRPEPEQKGGDADDVERKFWDVMAKHHP